MRVLSYSIFTAFLLLHFLDRLLSICFILNQSTNFVSVLLFSDFPGFKSIPKLTQTLFVKKSLGQRFPIDCFNSENAHTKQALVWTPEAMKRIRPRKLKTICTCKYFAEKINSPKTAVNFME
jgi:hypothetical protein